MDSSYPRRESILESAVEVTPLDRRTNMPSYMGSDIGQRIVDAQDAINERISFMGERLVKIETKLEEFQIPKLWDRVIYHDKVLYAAFVVGAGFGWFTKVILGK